MTTDNLTEKYKNAYKWISYEERRIQEDILSLRNHYKYGKISIENAKTLGQLFWRLRRAQQDFTEDKQAIIENLKGNL